MKVAVLGTGKVGLTLGKLWAEKGYDVLIGSREAEKGARLGAEIGASGGEMKAVVETADAVVLATPWYAFTDVERLLGEAIDGKVVVDVTNPFKSSGSLAVGHKWSGGEEVQKVWHRAKVVKAFNHIYVGSFEEPQINGERLTGFYCSNFDDAKAAAKELLESLGFEAVDAGPIKNARLLEPMAALWMQLAYVIHHDVGMGFRLVRSTD